MRLKHARDNGQPWLPSKATDRIRRMAADRQRDVSFTKHASERIAERSLIMSDVLWVLRTGFVHDPGKESTVNELYKYGIEGIPPNSLARAIKIIVVPDEVRNQVKIITVMWKSQS